MTIKGTPSTYNKDLQFDKQYAFNAFDRLQDALTVTEGVIKTMQLNRERMESALSPDMLATDWVSFFYIYAHIHMQLLTETIYTCRLTIWYVRVCHSVKLTTISARWLLMRKNVAWSSPKYLWVNYRKYAKNSMSTLRMCPIMVAMWINMM